MKPYVAADIKLLNRRSVYKLFEEHEELSRAEIARLTGISTPTVLKIISYFVSGGFVWEAGDGVSSMGRKPHLLRFNPEARYSVGVEYEGDFLKVGIVDLHGKVKFVQQIRLSGSFHDMMEHQLAAAVETVIAASGVEREKLLGLGIGIPAIVDSDRLRVSAAPLVGIHQDVDLRPLLDALSQRLGMDVYIENDANAAAMGEFIVRRQPETADLIYVSLGSGLGAGLVMQGRLLYGRRRFGGEIGFMVFDKGFRTSTDQSGWLEQSISLRRLCERWPFMQTLCDGEPWQSFASLPAFEELCDHVAGNLALCVANINSLLDLDTILVGGMTVKLLGSPLLNKVNDYLAHLSSCPIACLPQRSAEPCVVGAAMIATNQGLRLFWGM